MTNYFWSPPARSDWPSNLPNHIFLADAACQYGKAKFGAKWRDEGFNFMGSLRPKVYRLGSVKESPIDYFLLRAEMKREVFKFVTGLRASIVARDILESAQCGRVKLEARPFCGGEFVKIDRSVIDIDNMMHIFRRCSMDADRPFVQASANSQIFMTSVSFGGLMRLVRAREVDDLTLQNWVASKMAQHSQAELVDMAKTAFTGWKPPVRARVRAVEAMLRAKDPALDTRKQGPQRRA